MLKRVIRKFRPSPAMGVALLGLVVALGSTGWAANGAAFVLGVATNSATALTKLAANYNGSAMQLSNASVGISATALSLTTAATRPPMAVNSNIKVNHLNADWLDGFDSTALARVRHVPFTLAAGQSTAPIVLPANLPVHVMGTDGNCVGGATIFSKNGLVAWAGAGSCGENNVPFGQASDVGHRILVIEDLGGAGCPCGVVVQVAAGGAIRVTNTTVANSFSGDLTLVW